MTDIEQKIRDQKNKIKEDQRELSRLQEEMKQPKIKVVELYTQDRKNVGRAEITDNRHIQFFINDITTFFDKPSEPKSYVNWDKIYDGVYYVAKDRDGQIWGYVHGDSGMVRGEYTWHHKGSGYGVYFIDSSAIIGKVPAWDKSLIHRPGIKE